jgi:hypothetical protein
VARILVVGDATRTCELATSGHVVEDADGVDPERLATLTPRLESVSVVCWLFGESASEVLHGDRLESLLEYLVDTPVRGFVYARSPDHPRGEEIVARAHETFRIPCAVIAPGDDLGAAVAQVLAG